MSTAEHMATIEQLVQSPALNVGELRAQFPILKRRIRGKPLVYLDNAASAQRPQCVIDAVTRVYSEQYANVHRGVHYLSQKTTDAFEAAREKVRAFINAPSDKEIIFTRGTTESINLVAASYGRKFLEPGDEIVLTHMEHHSNIVPWQLLAQEKGATIRVVPINDQGQLVVDEYAKMLGPKTKIVAVVHVSNALGTINPVKRMIELAHEHGAVVLVDGAQAVPHMRVNVQDLNCDFYAFSGHKMYGPSGIGVLYGRRELLEKMPPYQGGGDMISSVSFEKTTYNELPYKFEAGTPNIAGTIGLGAAVDFLQDVGLDKIAAYETDLLAYGTELLSRVPQVKLYGTAPCKAGVLSFGLENVHPHDIGTILDQEGIAIRTGHHCTQPLMDRLGVPATARASLGLYNTKDELDALVAGLGKVLEVFG